MARGDGLALLETRLEEKSNSEGLKGFDPIMAIISMISGCVTPTTRVLRRRLGNQAGLATRIRKETGVSYAEAMKTTREVFDLADKATDQELLSLIDDCCTSDAPPVQPCPTPEVPPQEMQG